MAEPTACEKRWAEILASFQRYLDNLTGKNPEFIEDIKVLLAGLLTIGQVIQSSPRVNGNGAVWKGIITRDKAERAVLCKAPGGDSTLRRHDSPLCRHPRRVEKLPENGT
jgi:hypothetical protein